MESSSSRMSIPEGANDCAPEATKELTPFKDPTESQATTAVATPESTKSTGPPPRPQDEHVKSKPKAKQKKPNYALLHSKPLPVRVHPLPAFHPSNPISLLRLSYIYIRHLFSPPSSHPETLYTGLFSPRTRSVHITDPEHVRALWEMGFFGKGTLSRSEPSWLEREKARMRSERDGRAVGGGAEAATAKRREERRLFKLERARLEKEKIERQRAVEEGRLTVEEANAQDPEKTLVEEGDESTLVASTPASSPLPNGNADKMALHEGRVPDADLLNSPHSDAASTPSKPVATATKENSSVVAKEERDELDELVLNLQNQEHLKLTLEEAFFLTYGLGVLSIHPPPPSLNPAPFHPGPTPYSTTDMLFLSCHHSAFPPIDSGSGIAPDDQFLLNYVTYHHFRSLGWVVRPGVKFGVDYLLYNRGPVFSHAEFAVLIIPSYTHRYWNTPGGRSRRRIHYPSEKEGFSTLEEDGGAGDAPNTGKDWWFFHCINRVQSAVKKSLVLCYVDIPSPWEVGLDDEWDSNVDIGRLLRGYRVREFIVRRWVINRSRD